MPARIGFALTGSFCNFKAAFDSMKQLVKVGYELTPIFSEVSATTDTRFGSAADFIRQAEQICHRPPVLTMTEAETFGPGKCFDLYLIAPCTATSCSRLANGIYDTTVTLGAKAHLRNNRPILLAVCTNDALSFSAQTIGRLFPRKNHFFVPMVQDDPVQKPYSCVADFSLLAPAVEAALAHRQLRPLFLENKPRTQNDPAD